MRRIVLAHEYGHIAQRHHAHAFLGAAARPICRRDLGQPREIGGARRSKGRQARADRAALVITLVCNRIAIEIGKRGLRLVQEPLDAATEALVFEIGQVPHLLHR